MKILSHSLIFSSLLFSASITNAQTVIDPPISSVDNMNVSDFETVLYSDVFNNSDVSKTYTWQRNIIEMTEGWSSAICDNVQCYSSTVGSADFSLAGQSSGTMDVHLYPMNIEGAAIIEVIVTNSTDPDDSFTAMYNFNQTMSVPERLTNAINIFPNPAFEYVNIKAGNDVSRVEIFNASGAKVLAQRSSSISNIAIKELSQGAYILRMWNSQDVMLSTNVLIVE